MLRPALHGPPAGRTRYLRGGGKTQKKSPACPPSSRARRVTNADAILWLRLEP